MAKFFSSENWVWSPFNLIADVFILSGLWFLCSVPVVTAGAATAALYDCAARCVRGKDEKLFARFFRTFKRELLSGGLALALWAAVIACSYMLVKTFGNSVAVNETTTMLTVAMLLAVVVVVGVACWVLPLLSRFTLSFGQLNATAVKLALGNMPRTLLLGLSTVICGYFCILFWIPFFFLPAVLALIWTFLIEPVFRPFEEAQT